MLIKALFRIRVVYENILVGESKIIFFLQCSKKKENCPTPYSCMFYVCFIGICICRGRDKCAS